jgi:hypothetical protein
MAQSAKRVNLLKVLWGIEVQPHSLDIAGLDDFQGQLHITEFSTSGAVASGSPENATRFLGVEAELGASGDVCWHAVTPYARTHWA